MFTCEEIVKLAQAGFKPEQIVALAEIGQPKQAPAEQVPAPAAENVQNIVQEPAKEPEAPKQVAPAEANFPELNEAVSELRKATENMQRSAINNSNQPEKLSTDDILASIINPPMYQKKEV